MPKGKTVGTPTKKKAQPYMAKTEKGTVGVPKAKPKAAKSKFVSRAVKATIRERMPKARTAKKVRF